MASDPEDNAVTSEKSAVKSASPDTAERYSVDVWKEHARTRFDVSPHIIAGALHAAEPGQEFTESEVRKALKVMDEPIPGTDG